MAEKNAYTVAESVIDLAKRAIDKVRHINDTHVCPACLLGHELLELEGAFTKLRKRTTKSKPKAKTPVLEMNGE